jgi:hypothetical protein
MNCKLGTLPSGEVEIREGSPGVEGTSYSGDELAVRPKDGCINQMNFTRATKYLGMSTKHVNEIDQILFRSLSQSCFKRVLTYTSIVK